MTKRVYEDDNISDEILNSVFDELGEEEQHGGSLFEFPQHWKNTVHNQRYQSMLHQKRNPTRGDNLGREITDALTRPIRDTLTQNKVPLHYRMMFNLQSDHFTHPFNSVHFDVDEIMNPLLCTSYLCHETWLHKDENRDTKQHNENVRLHESYQARMARQLHQEASVPLGPCGHDALNSFQTLLAPIESHVDIIPVHGDLSSLRFNSLTFDTRMKALLNVL
ncbi:hypothetical protein pdam_00002957 [Pocillopora damicornis]|uniref:Uncharacterized protein n=1 Tax=Pocillopora damicornis TaxID=46731 RepID=A0A3M6U851_POCDA|nr:hypothetical protein pdam_00002957 [Pocillopora damicornis]